MKHRLTQLRARVGTRLARARQKGVTATQLTDALASALIWLILPPVGMTLYFSVVRQLMVLVGRIGHLASEPDSFLKARTLG